MIGKSSSLCSKIMDAIFILIEDVLCFIIWSYQTSYFLGSIFFLLHLLFALQRKGKHRSKFLLSSQCACSHSEVSRPLLLVLAVETNASAILATQSQVHETHMI